MSPSEQQQTADDIQPTLTPPGAIRRRRKPKQSLGYVQVPEGHGLETLSPNAYRLYTTLLGYIRPERGKTWCWPALETLRRRMGRPTRGRSMSTGAVRRARTELLSSGVVVVAQKGDGHPVWRHPVWRDEDDHLVNRTVYWLRVYVREGKVIDKREAPSPSKDLTHEIFSVAGRIPRGSGTLPPGKRDASPQGSGTLPEVNV